MKKCNLFLSLAALAIAAFATPAFSQFYFGAGAGGSHTTGLNGSTVVLGVPVTANGDSTRVSWKLLAGFQFTPNWGAEMQYTDLGSRKATFAFGAPVNLTGTTTWATASQWSIAGTGTLPLDNNFYLMGKLGASSNHIGSLSLTLGGVTATTGRANRSSAMEGIGAGYSFNKNLGLRLEYENFGKFSTNGGINSAPIKANNLALSLKYTF